MSICRRVRSRIRYGPSDDENWDETAWDALARAIVAQACADWRDAVRTMARYPDNEQKVFASRHTKCECEGFFRSRWFGQLTCINPKYLITRMEEVYGG